MPRQPKRYTVRVSRRSGLGLSGTTKSFTRKTDAITYAKGRRNDATVIDNETKDVLFRKNQ